MFKIAIYKLREIINNLEFMIVFFGIERGLGRKIAKTNN